MVSVFFTSIAIADVKFPHTKSSRNDNVAMSYTSFLQVVSCYNKRPTHEPEDMAACVNAMRMAGGDYVNLKQGQVVSVQSEQGVISIGRLEVNPVKDWYVFGL